MNCLQCGKEFEPYRQAKYRPNRGRFCSLKCSTKYVADHKPKPDTNVTCAYCGKAFYKSPSKLKCSKSGLSFCCKEHKTLAQRIGGIPEIMPAHYGTAAQNYRAIADRTHGLRHCQSCGYDVHPEILEVHHRDLNRQNNDPQNLEVLCPNCHTIRHFVPKERIELPTSSV